MCWVCFLWNVWRVSYGYGSSNVRLLMWCWLSKRLLFKVCNWRWVRCVSRYGVCKLIKVLWCVFCKRRKRWLGSYLMKLIVLSRVLIGICFFGRVWWGRVWWKRELLIFWWCCEGCFCVSWLRRKRWFWMCWRRRWSFWSCLCLVLIWKMLSCNNKF